MHLVEILVLVKKKNMLNDLLLDLRISKGPLVSKLFSDFTKLKFRCTGTTCLGSLFVMR